MKLTWCAHSGTDYSLSDIGVVCVQSLIERGWAIVNRNHLPAKNDDHRDQLLTLSRRLGNPVYSPGTSDPITVLRPTPPALSRQHSPSGYHGVGPFPFHTDGANLCVPHRFVVLHCVWPGLGQRTTRLVDFATLQLAPELLSLLHSEPLRVQSGRSSFYSTVMSKQRKFVRLDPCCMNPSTKSGTQMLHDLTEVLHSVPTHEINWEPGMQLIINNWRVVHSRSASGCLDDDRTLLRIYVA